MVFFVYSPLQMKEMALLKKKIRFIVNPISGTQKKKRIPALIKKIMDQSRYEIDIASTEFKGHAELLTSEAVDNGYFAVVAVGGDGTVNEVGRKLINTKTALGIIPCGSGNGLARHIHIPLDLRKAIEIINEGLVKAIDYGMMNDLPFFCTCGVGFDALVSFQFALDGRRGILTYIEKTLLEFLKYRPATYELEMDGGVKKFKAFLITCGNASQYGNNAFISPNASLQDGLLDITILEPFTVIDIPSLVFQLFNKLISQNSRIKTFRCKELTIRRKEEGVAHFDGDPITLGKDIHVQVVSKGLTVLTPRKVEYNPIEVAQHFINPVIEEVTSINRSIINRNIEFLRNILKGIKE